MESSFIQKNDEKEKCQKLYQKNYELILTSHQKQMFKTLDFKYLQRSSPRLDFAESYKTLILDGLLNKKNANLQNLEKNIDYNQFLYILLSFLTIYEVKIKLSHFDFVNF